MPSNLRLRVPPYQLTGLAQILHLSDELVQQLAEALRNAPLVASPRELLSYLALKVQVAPYSLEEILPVLTSLTDLRTELEVPISEVVDAVVTAMTETEEFTLTDDQREALKERLGVLLEPEYILSLVAKVSDLVNQDDHVFLDARIVTDIRPVFTSDPSEPPAAGLIVHQLKITYREGDRARDFFVAMDGSDVRRLRALLSRADIKAQSLTALLKKAKVVALGGEVQDGTS